MFVSAGLMLALVLGMGRWGRGLFLFPSTIHVEDFIRQLQQARAALNGTGSGKATGRGRGPRTMSAAARARIAAAQRARWTKLKRQVKKK